MTLHATVLAGVALIAGATLAGAWISSRTGRMPSAALRIAGVLLLAVVIGDLLPDIGHDLPGSGVPGWGAAGAAAAGFAIAGMLARRGCACASKPAASADPAGLADLGQAGSRCASNGNNTGWGATAALAVHRTLEGAAVSLAASAAVIAALVVHAAAEGFALAALLRAGRQRRAPLLLVACVSPVAGAFGVSLISVPAAVSVLLTCVIAGVLTRSALTAWQAARSRAAGQPANPRPLARQPESRPDDANIGYVNFI
jgi:zinc transporter ZupT